MYGILIFIIEAMKKLKMAIISIVYKISGWSLIIKVMLSLKSLFTVEKYWPAFYGYYPLAFFV